jgi:hypothetical protein
MDKATIREHLARAEANVLLGWTHIAQQRALIVKLDHDCIDATLAREVLKTFEEMQSAHVADRDRLTKELTVGG